MKKIFFLRKRKETNQTLSEIIVQYIQSRWINKGIKDAKDMKLYITIKLFLLKVNWGKLKYAARNNYSHTSTVDSKEKIQ